MNLVLPEVHRKVVLDHQLQEGEEVHHPHIVREDRLVWIAFTMRKKTNHIKLILINLCEFFSNVKCLIHFVHKCNH